MVTTAEPSATLALTGLLRLTWKVSSGSTVVSPLTSTVIVCVVVPGGKLSVPLAAVALAADSVTVNTAGVVPLLPSVTLMSAMDNEGAASSLMIVPRPWPSVSVAPLTLVTLTKKSSVNSCSVSPLTCTTNL
ncbi:hypothetical protein G6F68_015306 [Rhizopus microsporus]|nr:hypothetical protein G6F68_015306 [Rhizopus microsporus]